MRGDLGDGGVQEWGPQGCQWRQMCTAEARLGSPVLRLRLQEGSLEELSEPAPRFTRGETRTGRL